MNLFELARNNTSLRFVDDRNGNEYLIDELPKVSLPSAQKEIVFLYLDNSIESIALFWSMMRSRHCGVLLSPTIADHLKKELEILYRPRFIFDLTRTSIEGYDQKSEGRLQYFGSTVPHPVDIHSEVKLLISTSGTTGSPKFVKLSEANLVRNAESICAYLPIKQSDVTPLNLPVYYSYGLSVLTSNSLMGGKIVCSNDDVLRKSFWEKFEKFGYTSIAGVPHLYEMLDRIGFTKKQYSSLRYFTQAGGKLQDTFVKRYSDYANANKILFFVMYGQTEATARISYVAPERLSQKIGSIGKPIKDGNFVLDAETGELCYSGPNVFAGYVNQPVDFAQFEPVALLRTGDIAKMDDEGFYYITGRIKRFVKLFGSRVNLDEVESLLSKHLEIIARCIGVNDQHMVIFVSPGVVKEEVIQFLSKELKLHISALRVVEIDHIPLTNNGKVDYTSLTKSYAAS